MLVKFCRNHFCCNGSAVYLSYINKIHKLTCMRFISKETKTQFEANITMPKYIKAAIKFKGPLTVAEYMKEVLTNPVLGYYMNKDVFGQKGDFITSPELNQLFGEMIAIWMINEWKKLGSQKPHYIVELGPGRGSMMADILRVYKTLDYLDDLSCHLVELSPEMSKLQAQNLEVNLQKCDDVNSQCFQKGITKNGVPVTWYNHLKSVPPEFSIVVAHEFFDALPVHKFKKTKHGWREILIDIDSKDPNEHSFRYVIAPGPTPHSRIFVKESETRDEIEVSPESGVIMNELAVRLEQYGGFALIADYGHNGTLTDTFRAYKGHRQHNPLVEPGSADLTADVDFNYLKQNTLNKLISFGPVTQREFLLRMHIDDRLKMLLKNCPDEEARNRLITGYKMMMDHKQMGDRFKFISFFPAVVKPYLEKFPVTGFGI
ncbi:protein arginine methyltransferase NDUFAF7, mitochondrial [Lycorma delicatula]|uniref:protein arginine methyltransferase NDUFAF7, mitochondrial n=1 Tax=Lycorma delicatula TaxID=130591 RepID=UPI003F5131E5